ncbi:MAG TPA: hypothetical protein VHC43_01065 [Mycobacteriales bacterium]|nr:hypothetical protein [Mycobacteriales bacterium]HVW80173.1 hypothetical protein [Mycobacteriales bacterium]
MGHLFVVFLEMYLFWRWRDLRVHSHLAIAAGALILLLVDSTVAGVRAGSPPAAAAPPSLASRHEVLSPRRGLRGELVVSGSGWLWLLARDGKHAHSLEQVDPRTEQIHSSTRVAGPASYLFYGAGRVWVTGGSTIRALDPRSGRLSVLRAAGGTVRSMTFARSKAYAVVAGRDEVLAISPGRRLRAHTIVEHGGPSTAVALSDAIEITNHRANLVPVIFPRADTSFLAALQLGRAVIAAAGPQAAWVRRGHELVRETLSRAAGSASRPARHYVDTLGRPEHVVMTADGGCYVSIGRTSGRARRTDVLYFSRSALRSRHPRPSAVHRGPHVRSLALDPAGGVVFTDAVGDLVRWVPTVKSLR